MVLRPALARLPIASAVLALCACGGGGGPAASSPALSGDDAVGITEVGIGASAGIGTATEPSAPVVSRPMTPSAPTSSAPMASGSPAVSPPPAFAPAMRRILADVPVSSSQYVTYQTPVAAARGAVYIANVEPAGDGDGPGARLQTVVRRGVPDGEGAWRWESRAVDLRTGYDRWHLPPAVGVDRDGHVHVAYNMHNFPWQYSVSSEPDSIDAFRFLGEPVTDAELDRHLLENRTTFDDPGIAAIPGTQITYPAFFRDRDDELYVSYRRAARPALDFEQRTMSAAIARYDTASGRWAALGGEVAIRPGDAIADDGFAPRPAVVLAARQGWTAYPPKLAFDASNRLHALWFWREGTAGPTLVRPCAVVREASGAFRLLDGAPVTPPLKPDGCGGTAPGDGEFRTVSDTAMGPDGALHVVVSPVDAPRYIARWDGARWRSVPAPDDAGEIFFDAGGTLWALSSGPTAWRRPAGAAEFEPVLDAPSGDDCYPRATLSPDRRVAYVHARGCNADRVSVYEIELMRRD